MIAVRFRPLPVWDYAKDGPLEGLPTPFTVGHADTLRILDRELGKLGAEAVTIQVGLRESQIRRDGWPKDGAAAPAHPGVVLSFRSDQGSLRYATGVFYRYEVNLRAIALGLESLRRVDRYGITRGGAQYAGFRELTAGGPSAERGRKLIDHHGGERAALQATHPDHGGSPEDFADVQAARGES